MSTLYVWAFYFSDNWYNIIFLIQDSGSLPIFLDAWKWKKHEYHKLTKSVRVIWALFVKLSISWQEIAENWIDTPSIALAALIWERDCRLLLVKAFTVYSQSEPRLRKAKHYTFIPVPFSHTSHHCITHPRILGGRSTLGNYRFPKGGRYEILLWIFFFPGQNVIYCGTRFERMLDIC